MRKLALLFFALCSFAHSAFANLEVAPINRATYILEKVKEGDAVCRNATLSAITETTATTGVTRITERPVALCAFSETTKSWHVIYVALKYPVPGEYITCIKSAPTLPGRKSCQLPFRVMTPGFQVEHLRGYGITRLIFDVYSEKFDQTQVGGETKEVRTRNEKLTVYRTRHLWFDDEALASGDVDRVVKTTTAKNYTPDHPDFIDDELVDTGALFLFEKVRSAQQALGLDPSRPSSVRSHAFPDRTLGDVVPWETVMSLAIIEQMDDMTFFSDKKLATESVLREYALNREEAFRWSQSGANAIGPLQFTESGGNGTYSAMVRGYPDANLEPQFQVGARDLGNVLKAAIALIDYEVAQFPEIKPIFEKNPKIGGAFPVAAYNGGPSSARALYAWLKKNRISIEHKEINFPQSFAMKRTEKCPCKDASAQKGKKNRIVSHIVVKVQNTETPGYLVKYFYLLNYLADKELE